MRTRAWPDCEPTCRADTIEAVFDWADDLADRLHQGPGEQARQELGLPAEESLPNRWRLRTIRASIPELAGYSLSGVWRLLWRSRLALRSARVQQFSPDPAYAEKEERLLALLREAAAHPDEVEVLFLDEMGSDRWPEAARTWGPVAPAPVVVAERKGEERKWRIGAALNARSGQVLFVDKQVVGREKLAELYRKIAAAYPHARRIYVVQDNWPIHRHSDVLATVEALPQLELVWLPTAAFWLNPIEKLWRKLRQEILKLHRMAGDWSGLRAQVRAFLAQFAAGSEELLQYVGLKGEGKLAACLTAT